MRKKLFAILMSAMMMVTFMPAMAFAAECDAAVSTFNPNPATVEWNADFTEVTMNYVCPKCGQIVKVPGVVAKPVFQGGYYTVTATFGTNSGWESFEDQTAIVEYIDLAGATVMFDTDNVVDWDTYINHIAPTTPDPVNPTSVKVVNGTNKADLTMYELDKHWLYLLKNDYNKMGATEAYATTDKTVTVEVDAAKIKAGKDADGNYWQFGDGHTTYNATKLAVLNSATAKVTLKKESNANYSNLKATVAGFVDADKAPYVVADGNGDGNYSIGNAYGHDAVVYDGNEHAVSLTPTAGLDVTYALTSFVPSNGVETVKDTPVYSATPVSVKNAGMYAIGYKVKRAGMTYDLAYTGTIYVKVGTATPVLQFTQESFKFAMGQEFDITDVAKVTGIAATDIDAFKAYADKYVKLTGVIKQLGTSTLGFAVDTLQVAQDVKTDAALKALLANYNTVNATDTARLEIAETKNDVTTVDQTKTYKNKTGKLAKTWTFMCKGDFADYGTLSFYKTSGNAKITVAKDGKVTVQKGLKKGTYTVKVKVKAPGASAVKTLKVIVKK